MKFNIQLFAPQPSATIAITIDDVEVVFNSGFNQFASDIDEIPGNENFSYDSTTHYVKYQNKVLYDKITGAHVLSTDDPWDYDSTNSGDPLITATTYKHLTTSDNTKIQVDSAIRDGNGKKIDIHYQTKLPSTTIADKILVSTSTAGTVQWADMPNGKHIGGQTSETATDIVSLGSGVYVWKSGTYVNFIIGQNSRIYQNADNEDIPFICMLQKDTNNTVEEIHITGNISTFTISIPYKVYSGKLAENRIYVNNNVVSATTDSFVRGVLNNSRDLQTFYAPINAGTAGQYLKSNGSNTAPAWDNLHPELINVSTTGVVSQTMAVNKYYDFTGNISNLNLILADPGTDYSYYKCKFYSGFSAPTVNITPYSGNIRWASMASLAALDSMTYYILEIENNIGTLTPISDTYWIMDNTYVYANNYYKSTTDVGGSVTITDINNNSTVSTGQILVGHSYSITATPATNFTLQSITVNNTAVSNNSTITPQYDQNIDVKFKGNNTTLTYNTPTGVTITTSNQSTSSTITSGCTIKYYDVFTLVMTPDTGYTNIQTAATGLTELSRSTNSSTNALTVRWQVTDVDPTITISVTAPSS